MKEGTSKGWPDRGRQIYRDPDGTTITLDELESGQWHAAVKWQGYKADAAPFKTPADALQWARAQRANMTITPSANP